jgi:two-component system sensor histidine kinase PilS (NtrC family)
MPSAPADDARGNAGAGSAVPDSTVPTSTVPTSTVPASFWTSLRYFAVSRVVLTGVLLLFAVFDDPLRAADPSFDPALFLGAAIAYLVLSGAYLVGVNLARRGFHAQLLVHVFTDLVALLVLMHAAGGIRSGVGVLMVAAVAGAAVISGAQLAAFFAASATLLLLAHSTWTAIGAGSVDAGNFGQVALIGAACFATAALINRLASRLAAQEALAQRRGLDLHSQLAITQVVISELPQGVVVLDPDGRVRTMNRSAQELLAVPGRQAALEALIAQRRRQGLHRGGDEVDLAPDTGVHPQAVGRLRARFLKPVAASGSDTVIVIEDPRHVEERAQQLKLASMGRLSASIAHEIRNPLAAIRHANGLLAERQADPQLRRLARIVEDNSVRIDRIVEDVLSIARRERPSTEAIDVAAFLATLLPEFAAACGADPARVQVQLASAEPLHFDPHHLRQVLVNLMTNALRYASGRPGAVSLQWRRGAGDRLEFRVSDDGPGLPPDMLEHAFEPFFTTEARGTGLGLFLAREFCAANDATLRYEPAPADGDGCGAFVIQPRPEPGA